MNGVDVGKKEQVADALKKVFLQTHRIDYIINTAGVLNKEPLMSSDYQTIYNAVSTNYMGNYQRSDGGVRLFKRKQREISFLHLQFLYSRQSFLQHLFLYESGHCKLCTSYRTRMGTVWHCC